MDRTLPEYKLILLRTLLSSYRNSNTTPEDLSEVWKISIEQPKMTLYATTQHHIQLAIMTLSCQYRMDGMLKTRDSVIG